MYAKLHLGRLWSLWLSNGERRRMLVSLHCQRLSRLCRWCWLWLCLDESLFNGLDRTLEGLRDFTGCLTYL
jgi:hypothetical protein